MNQNKKNGLLNLAKKTMAIISASISTLTATGANICETVEHINENPNSIEELAAKKELKPQFMLRLNSNLERSILFMHRSHSSHSSHRSHSSHYSSSSSYSPPAPASTSSTVYRPPASTYTPSTYTPTTTAKRSSAIMSATKSKSNYTGTHAISPGTLEILGYYYRTLFKDCEGLDVEYLQKLLEAAGYDTPTTGYFGDKTEQSVKKFQKENELKPDGKVGQKTFSILKAKVDGI